MKKSKIQSRFRKNKQRFSHRFKLTCLSAYSFIIITLIISTKGRKLRKASAIFVNYRSFGHSISDTNAFLVTYGDKALCISLGKISERNRYLSKFINYNNLLDITLRGDFLFGRLNMRKHIGPLIGKYLKFLSKIGILKKDLQIFTENKFLVLNCLEKRISSLSLMDFYQSKKLIDNIRRIDKKARESSKAVAFWAQIYDANSSSDFKINDHTKEEYSFLNKLRSINVNPKNVVTLILRTGGSPHHGPGFSYYDEIIQDLNRRGIFIILLGDTNISEINLRKHSNLYNARMLGLDAKSLPFISIKHSLFTIGDSSGVWTIVTLLGKIGLLLNTIPSRSLCNKIEVLPRIWVDMNGKFCGLEHLFNSLGETVRNENRGNWVDGFHPVIHSKEMIFRVYVRFIVERLSGKHIKMDERYFKYFADYEIPLMQNCAISPELLDLA